MPKKHIAKAYALTDVEIQFVSLVDRPANKRKFLVTKAEDGKATISTDGKIVKADAETHHVTGVVYEPMAEDTQGNYMTAEEIEKAAHLFMKNHGGVDLQHSFKTMPNASVVESWVAKEDTDFDGEPVKKGTWLVTMEIQDDEIWSGIQKGDITGFSMGGYGRYSDQDDDLDEISKAVTKGFFKRITKALNIVSDVEKTGRVLSQKNLAALTAIHEDLGDFLSAYLESEEDAKKKEDAPKKDGPKEGDDKGADGGDDSTVQKGDVDMTEAETKELFTKMFDEQSEKLIQKTATVFAEEMGKVMEKMVKADEPVQKSEPDPEPAAKDLEQIVVDSVAKGVEQVLKTCGVSTQKTPEPQAEPQGEHYLHNLLGL